MQAAAPLFSCLFAFLILSGSALAAPATQEDILTLAREKNLQSDPYWMVLGHYRRGPLGVRSLVDDPDFFLAPDGKTNPGAELEATIRAFFQPLPPEGQKHPACRFPARLAWITERLGLPPPVFPVTGCKPFEDVFQAIKPESAVLIFPTAHVNSPASMFGHTLIALETKDHSRLLAHAVNYSAVTGKSWGPVYAAKGLFGMYPGYFSMLPYYEKIQQYSDVAHRDIWEYPLNLTPQELRRLLLHLYEMDGVHADYFFVDENCSFNLLFLLDAARPGSDLVGQCPYVAAPVDTIRLMQQCGFISAPPAYRPSKMTKINRLKSNLSAKDIKNALAMTQGASNPQAAAGAPGVSQDVKANTLELAAEIISYRYTRKIIDQATYTERYRGALAARSALGPWQQPPQPDPEPPDQGHLTSKAWISAGLFHGDAVARFGFRPLLHGFSDPAAGYEKGAQILFMDTAMDYDPEEGTVRLHHMDILNIFSMAPRDQVFKPLSWRLGLGFQQMLKDDGDSGLAFDLAPGGGVAYSLPGLGLGYAMVEGRLAAAPGLDRGFAAGPGVRAGVLADVSTWWRLKLEAEATAFALGDCYSTVDFSIDQNFRMSQNTGLRANLLFRRARDFSDTEAELAFSLYF